ncbi:MAG: metallophosphoesterase [Fimbriimonas sp.]
MPLVLLAAALALNPPTAQKWCFVVGGDGRAAGPASKRPEDRGGVNYVITKEIAEATIRENARFLAWTGDLVYGYSKDPATFERQLLVWRGIMQPLYNRHIKVLPCRGNHEAGAVESERIWNKVFSGPHSLPQNGPASEKNLSWFYTKGDVLFVGLDQYQMLAETIDQGWFDKTLKENPKPFVFSMGHEPAFMDGSHTDTMDAHPEKRDVFWQSLIDAGSRAFFCGHDHLYDHMKVVRNGPNRGPEMHQYVAGTSGAPFYKEGVYRGKNTDWKLERVKHIDNTYGYLLVTIEGKKATIEFKGRKSPGVYETTDTWSYTTSR